MCVCACAPRPAPECSWVVVFCENRGLGGFGVLRRSGVFGGGFTTRLRAVVWYAIGGSIFFSFSPLRKMCLVQTPHRSDFFLLFFFFGGKSYCAWPLTFGF